MKFFDKIILVVFLSMNISCSFGNINAVKELNVRNFGATGDGNSDDYFAIENCIKAALKFDHARIIFPHGRYRISQTIILHYLANEIEIIGLKKGDELPTIFSNDPNSLLSIRGYIKNESAGTVLIKNLKLEGGFDSYSHDNPFINKIDWYYGISITDKKSAIVENVNVSNIYGEGIYISTTIQTGIALSSRFDGVQIRNCKIINCWGYNPKNDNYGDGIYISNVRSALVSENLISNDFSTTKQLGRSGIVVEYMSQNCVISQNQIFGYDRGIHLEADYGSHKILNNNISGSDMGIVLENDEIEGHNNPVLIRGNIISNFGFPKNKNLSRTRDISALSDRSLLNFVARGKSRAGSIIENNKIIIDGNYDYFSNTIVNIKADDLIIRNNQYKVLNRGKLKHQILFNNYSNSSPSNDDFDGIELLKFREGRTQNVEKIKMNNRMHSTQIEVNL